MLAPPTVWAVGTQGFGGDREVRERPRGARGSPPVEGGQRGRDGTGREGPGGAGASWRRKRFMTAQAGGVVLRATHPTSRRPRRLRRTPPPAARVGHGCRRASRSAAWVEVHSTGPGARTRPPPPSPRLDTPVRPAPLGAVAPPRPIGSGWTQGRSGRPTTNASPRDFRRLAKACLP